MTKMVFEKTFFYPEDENMNTKQAIQESLDVKKAFLDKSDDIEKAAYKIVEALKKGNSLDE